MLDATKKAFIKDTLIPAAMDFLTASLSVLPVSGNLVMSSPMSDGACFGTDRWYSLVCCQRFWPSKYVNPGQANADFVLVLTTRPTRGSLLAFATGELPRNAGRAFVQIGLDVAAGHPAA